MYFLNICNNKIAHSFEKKLNIHLFLSQQCVADLADTIILKMLLATSPFFCFEKNDLERTYLDLLE